MLPDEKNKLTVERIHELRLRVRGMAPAQVAAILLSVQILFGINYVVSKFVLAAFPPLVWASIRSIITAVMMFAFAAFFARRHPKTSPKFFGQLLIFGLLGFALNQATFLIGLKHTTSTHSALLNTLIPIFTLILVIFRKQEKPTFHLIFGFISAFVGVLVLNQIDSFSFENRTFFGDAITIVNCISYSIFLAYSKSFLERHDRVWVTAYLFGVGSIALTLFALPEWKTFEMPVMTPVLWSCVAFNILGATFLTYLLINVTLAYTEASHVALFVYIQPIVATVVAWLCFDEQIGTRALISAVFIFVGVFFALARPKLKEQAPSQQPTETVNSRAVGE